ncbi:kinase-like protein [Backusella circina FSU 941]|nr:kinase-like protein [Backusella circina FSU 941]
MVAHQDSYWSQLSSTMVDKVIDDEFELLEVLGHGAYGCLFLGQSTKDMSYVAVKVLTKSGLDLQQLQLQQLEIDIQTSLKHPNLLALHRVIQDADYIYMVMELCDQGDLFDFVIRDQEINPIRSESLVKKIYISILDAVQAMHDNQVYHRDLKLENVLLQCQDDEDEENFICKVADFGLATRERYSTEFGCGSTSYLAPEHFEDESTTTNNNNNNGAEFLPYDAAASDIWSLGVLLLALMFGRNPWQEASTADAAYNEFKRNPSILKEQLFPELSLSASRFLESALATNGSDRPSIAELKEQFLSIDRLLVDQDEDDSYYGEEIPLSIPTAAGAVKHSDITSYDSAFFSGTGSSSWSDMMDEEEDQVELCKPDFENNCYHTASPSLSYFDEDDTDMFVHSGEKESWWL